MPSQVRELKKKAFTWIVLHPEELKQLVNESVTDYCTAKRQGGRHNVERDIRIATELNEQVQKGNFDALLTFVEGRNKERTFMGFSMGPSQYENSLMHFLSYSLVNTLLESTITLSSSDIEFQVQNRKIMITDISELTDPTEPPDPVNITPRELLEAGLRTLCTKKNIEAQPQKKAENASTVSIGGTTVISEVRPPRYLNKSDLDRLPNPLPATAIDANNEAENEIDTELITATEQTDIKTTLKKIREKEQQDQSLKSGSKPPSRSGP